MMSVANNNETEEVNPKKLNKKLLVVFLTITILLGGIIVIYVTFFALDVKFVVKVESVSIIEGEDIPAFVTTVTSTSEVEKRVLPFGRKSVGDILEDLSSENAYRVSCAAHESVEGEYLIEIEVNPALQKELRNKLVLENGILIIQNKYGEWEGSKFRRYDGTYVEEEFITWQGERYYLDGNGNKVIGELLLQCQMYTFDEDGRLISEVHFIDQTKPMIALTYDDGPGRRTNELLDALEENCASATFFLIGQNIHAEDSALLLRMLEIGSEIANHSWTHPYFNTISGEMIKQEVADTTAKILEVTGIAPAIMRLPYGATSAFVEEMIEMPLVFWSVDTLDWKHRDVQTTIDTIMEEVTDGDIILMHDIHDATIEAAKILIPALKEAGYQMVTVSELAEFRGINMEGGESYISFPAMTQ